MKHPTWTLLHPAMTPDALGFIPGWLSEADPRPAAAQLNDYYRHGGGWNPFHGFELRANNSLKYPGDPALRPLAQAHLREELILFYSHSWVAIVQPPDASGHRAFEVSRMD